MAKDRILITGAAGFIGSHLVDRLLSKGVTPSQLRLLIAPWDSLENLSHLDLSKIEIVKADVRNKKKMKLICEGMNYVYHLAAKIDFDGSSYHEYKSVNVMGTRNLLDACSNQPIKKFVFYSSIGVFGLPAGVGNIEGWDETHPKTYSNWYGRSKWEAELCVVKAHKEHNLPYAIIRPASVYGPREKGPTLALFKAIKNGKFLLIGNGENKMHYVFVGDLVEATYLAAKSRKKSGDYIIAGKEPSSLKTIVTTIGKVLDARIFPLHIPTPIALCLSYCMEAAGKIVGISSPLFPSRVRTMTTTYYYTINKARRELTYSPEISIKKGLKLTGEWYISHGWL
jgi:nucleoside-diphosphate-sugar epimerase